MMQPNMPRTESRQSRSLRFSCAAIGYVAVCVIVAIAPTGCADDEFDAGAPTAAAPKPTSPAWRVDEVEGQSSIRLAIDEEPLKSALDEAIAKARETADAAREQWRASPESQRDRWAVKWAAPIQGDEQAVEHVWVQPLHWSAFRIEGVLLSQPDRPLDVPSEQPNRGELVSFPAEQLSDWVRYHTLDPAGPRDGGYTIDVIEHHAGRP
jgi:uncharacterized protein YegJ (DUF2314 family)